MILATAAAAIAAFCSLAFSWWRWCEVTGLGAGGFNPARRCRVPVVGEIEPLGGRGDGAGGFISMAPRWGAAAVTAGGLEGGEVITVVLLLPAERVLEGGDGERDLDRES